VKEPLVLRVAPDKKLESWRVIREGRKAPCGKGLTKHKAVQLATKLIAKETRPAIVLVHKTRYIIERSLS